MASTLRIACKVQSTLKKYHITKNFLKIWNQQNFINIWAIFLELHFWIVKQGDSFFLLDILWCHIGWEKIGESRDCQGWRGINRNKRCIVWGYVPKNENWDPRDSKCKQCAHTYLLPKKVKLPLVLYRDSELYVVLHRNLYVQRF